MDTERIPCKNPECRATILPITVKINDGLCAPCAGKIRQAARNEYIRLNRRTVNLYEGVTDPVEAIRIMLTRRKPDPLIQYAPSPKFLETWFAELTDHQTGRLAEIAAEAMKSGEQYLAQEIGRALATLTGQNLDAMLHAWLDTGHMSPDIAFRNAGATVRDRLLTTIETTQPPYALCALAWIGDETVQRQFAAWERHPPEWRKTLHVGPAEFAHVGGWELCDGERRNLFFDQCLALDPAGPGVAPSAVRLIVEQSQQCPWCGDKLVHLLEIPTRDPEFGFLGFAGDLLPVLTCERCTCWYEPLFARVRPSGEAEWHPANQRSPQPARADSPWDRGPWKGVAVVLKPRSAIRAADWCMHLPGTQIGGMPTWVQDTAFPQCPDCSRTMKFIAQLDNDHFPGHEGTYYAFLCAECRVTATAYQQT